jgi:hypothetical protein
LLEAPELVKEVPKDATALLWGYEANHPYAEQCAKLTKAKRRFWVCPGTSAWNTFTGRTDNMLTNIESAAKHGLANRAEGFLLTSWGDGGNHQPWPIMYPGVAYAAGMAWNAKGTKRADLTRAVDWIFRDECETGLGNLLEELGRVENGIAKPKPNRSRHYDLFFATRAKLAEELKSLTRVELKGIAMHIARLRRKLPNTNSNGKRRVEAKQELRLGADMAAWAVKRAQLTSAGKNTRVLRRELRALIGKFEELWQARARPGGLPEASERMRAVEKEL